MSLDADDASKILCPVCGSEAFQEKCKVICRSEICCTGLSIIAQSFDMKKIVVASKNPVKIEAALLGFQKMFPGEEFEIEGMSVPTGVNEQPIGHDETLQGAMNRACSVFDLCDADFCVGIEGGVEDLGDDMRETAWVVVKSRNGQIGKAATGSFFLPEQMANLIRQGKELGEANDIIFGLENSKQSCGAVGMLTGQAIDRTKYCVEAVVLALIPFKNPELYD